MKPSTKTSGGGGIIRSRLKRSGEALICGRPCIPMLREKIMRSAIDLFAERGFDRVSVDEIAARAGVGKGSVYRQFSSKGVLYALAVIDGYVDLRTQIAAALESAESISEAVTIVVSKMVSYFWNRLDFFDQLRNPAKLPREHENRYGRERQKLARIVSKVFAQGAATGVIRDDLAPDLLVESLLGMIRGIQRYRRGALSLSQDEVVRTVVDVFLHGCSRHSSGATELVARSFVPTEVCRQDGASPFLG